MDIICVDNEQAALDQFMLTTVLLPLVEDMQLFLDGESALVWAGSHNVDVAFLDIEMPGMNGLELARRLKEMDPNIRIVFVTAHEQYALDAFRVDAIGYVLKPYSREDIQRELDKAFRIRPRPVHRMVIQTIPNFSVSVDGNALQIRRPKVVELFALLVDRGERGITSGEGIACLWPERPGDSNAQTLFRMTYKRLADALEEAGVGDIIATKGNRRFLRENLVDCDLYKIMAGDAQTAKRYAGEYLCEYSWAEDRNGQLYRMLLSNLE